MKTILVDAINSFIDKDTGIDKEMFRILESYPNPKIILTGADDEQIKKFGLDNMPYKVFTLKHDPEKSDPEYFRTMLEEFSLSTNDVLYFEHDPEAIESAMSVGIDTHYYDKDKKDLQALKNFLDQNL